MEAAAFPCYSCRVTVRLSVMRFLSRIATMSKATLFLFLTLTGLSVCEIQGAERERMNVLFIASDDMRPELGCYGANHIHSPNLDRLAANGTTFLRAYCQQAVCSPSRSSLMTGLRPDTIRIWDLATHFRKNVPDVVTLAQHFKNHGYHTERTRKDLSHGSWELRRQALLVPHVEISAGIAVWTGRKRAFEARVSGSKSQGR